MHCRFPVTWFAKIVFKASEGVLRMLQHLHLYLMLYADLRATRLCKTINFFSSCCACVHKIVDPTPHNPWTNDDMYDVMMHHFDHSDRDVNIWCMIASEPPDHRYLGYSFDKDGCRGFGLFTKYTCEI